MNHQLPEEFTKEMKRLLQEDYDQYLNSLEEQVKSGLRINTRKGTVEEIREFLPFQLENIPWIKDGFTYPASIQPSKDPAYAAGLYYLQEPSAMTPADRLPVEKGDHVLDLCAAPGGKATKLACKLGETGMLFANDISNSRAKALLKNLELFGIDNMCVMSEKPEKLAAYYPEYFDKILIDAPCSGEGMFHKEPRMVQDWLEKGPDYYAPIQAALLEQAYQMLRPGGMMLFSTCTFSKKENEDNVIRILESHGDLSLEEIKPYSGFSHSGAPLEKCVRIFPHKMQGEGHFLALMKKKENTDNSRGAARGLFKGEKKRLPGETREFLDKIDFKRDYNYHIIQERLYGLPEGFIPNKKLRYLRTGLYMGDLKKNRFEPSQALAMTLTRADFSECISLKRDDYRLIRYLKGETIDIADYGEKNGWCLVCVEQFPLGWGRAQRGILKNKYNSGWRWS